MKRLSVTCYPDIVMSTLQPSVNRALVLHPGGTFTHSERRIPTIESDRDVLVRVVATGLCGSDVRDNSSLLIRSMILSYCLHADSLLAAWKAR